MATQNSISVGVQLELFANAGSQNHPNRRPEHVDQQIINRYISGESAPAIAASIGITKSSVYQLLIRNGVTRRPASQSKLPAAVAQEVVAKYLAGLSEDNVAREFGFSRSVVHDILVRENIDRRSRASYRPALRQDAFSPENVNASPDTCWWIGMLMADGNVYYSKQNPSLPSIALALKSSDAYVLEAFKGFLRSDCVVRTKPHGVKKDGTEIFITRFSVASAMMANDLARWGVVPRKSLTAAFVDIHILPFAYALWRGAIDGDGSLAIRATGKSNGYARLTPSICLSGSRNLTHQFADYVRSISPECTAIPSQGRTCWTMTAGGRHALAVVRELYDRPGEMALTRKAAIAAKILEWEPILDRVSDDTVTTVLTMRAAGHSWDDIGEVVGKGREAVRAIFRNKGGISGPAARKFSSAEDAKLIEMRSAGCGWSEIGAALGRRGTSIRGRALEHLGLK